MGKDLDDVQVISRLLPLFPAPFPVLPSQEKVRMSL